MSAEPFASIRERTGEVMRRARFVAIDATFLAKLASEWETRPSLPMWDPETHFSGDRETLLAYVLTLDALNFGSGWFPWLRKREGRSGYYVLSLGLKERFEAEGAWSARALQQIDEGEIARVLGQDSCHTELAELFGLYARALHDLGLLLEKHFAGRFEALVEACHGCAANLVLTLARMPLFRDVAQYPGGLEIPFYKRAQIAVSDLAAAFSGNDYGAFADLGQLTAFADNTVPHVLRCDGVLHYEGTLARSVDSGEPLPPGSPPEVEIRAAAIQGVERLVQYLRERAVAVCAREVDAWLWNRGQRSEYKALPRHRTCTPYY